MPENVAQVLESVRLRIAKPIQEQEGDRWAHRYDPLMQEHTILLPVEDCTNEEDWLLCYLHELVHAALSEEVHPLLGGFDFERDYAANVISEVSAACRHAVDWFVWAEMVTLLPATVRTEIDLIYDSFFPPAARGDPSYIYQDTLTLGLVWALQAYWNGMSSAAQHYLTDAPDNDLGGMVQAYMSTPTNKPSIDCLQDLTNALLSVYSRYRVKYTGFELYPTWEVLPCDSA